MSTPVQVFVRDSTFNLIGQIEDFQSLVVTLKYNDVGTWELTVPADSPGAQLLDRVANPGGGIVLLRNGVQLMAGPARGHRWSRSGGTGNGVLTVVGLDDNWILASRLVWPDPTKAIGDQTMPVWYTNTALQPAETIMRNLVASQMARGTPHVLGTTDLGRGLSQQTPKWRFNTVMDSLQQMSVLSKPTSDTRGELGFKVTQVVASPLFPIPFLKFDVFLSNDHSDTVRFSFNVGNLAEAEYTTTAPQATYLVSGAGQTSDGSTAVGSSGTGADLNKSLFEWSRTDDFYPSIYSEGFLNASEIDPLDANAVAQMQQQVSDYWSTNGGQVAATFKAIDTAGMAFGEHYLLGDFVTVELPQLTFVERVRQIGLAYSADGGEDLTLAVGTENGTYGRLTPGHAISRQFDVYVKTAQARYAKLKADEAAKAAHDQHLHTLHMQHLHTLHMRHLQTVKNRKKKRK